MSKLFTSPWVIHFSSAIGLRIILLLYGIWQDNNTPLKFTDIDYFVFTDAAWFVAHGQSPYNRDTYRYTPILAWILWPTTISKMWFPFGKILFATGDILAGWLIVQILKRYKRLSDRQALAYASIWLLNPMVATISTRGSSEGLLGALVVALLWAVLERKIVLAGLLLGFGVHFKIYPFIYAPSIIWWLDDQKNSVSMQNLLLVEPAGVLSRIRNFINPSRLIITAVSLLVFFGLNTLMYLIYGFPFLQHTYFYHLTRIDHRHNFSPFNIHQYLSSAASSTTRSVPLTFFPQLLLSLIAIPLILAKKDLASTMLAQTFAFVTFNTVCTSQYFLWYIVLLPFYLPNSTLISHKVLGVAIATLWVSAQANWLHQAFQLEFLGRSTFVPGLWMSSIFFFLINSCILSIIVCDIGHESQVEILSVSEIRNG